MVKQVNPAGDVTPARQNAAACFGKRLWGTARAAARRVGKLLPLRVGWWWSPDLGWPETTATSSTAATDVGRVWRNGCRGLGDACVAPFASTCCGEYVGRVPVTKWSPELRRRRARRRRRFGRGGEEATVRERGGEEGETVA